MRTVNILCFTMLMLMLASCRTTSLIFHGEVVKVSSPKQITKLKGHTVDLEGIYTGGIYAYDGILIFTSHKFKDYNLYIYDAETGKLTNKLFKRGNGPDEIRYLVFDSEGFEKDSNGKINIWVNDFDRKNIMLANMQGKIIEKISTSEFKSTNFYGIGCFDVFNDSLLIAIMQTREVFENQFLAPFFRVYNYHTSETVRDYVFYSDYEMNTERDVYGNVYGRIHPVSLLDMRYAIKPDKSKIAVAMWGLNRIVILDLESGKAKSIETKDAKSLNYMQLGDHKGDYYGGVRCDDHYIYVEEGPSAQPGNGKIQVFDWNGNFEHILQISDRTVYFGFDPIRRIIYSITDEDEVIAYDVNFLYK